MGLILAFLIAFFIIVNLLDIMMDSWINVIKPFERDD